MVRVTGNCVTRSPSAWQSTDGTGEAVRVGRGVVVVVVEGVLVRVGALVGVEALENERAAEGVAVGLNSSEEKELGENERVLVGVRTAVEVGVT